MRVVPKTTSLRRVAYVLKITQYFEAWKTSEHRKQLILQGARQVGKTYSILEFGRTHYENVSYFNFEINPKLNETFAENISPEYLISILSHISNQTIVREKTLIVFDEVQLCKRALTSLKYFYEDAPDYHIIVAGSLLPTVIQLITGNRSEARKLILSFSEMTGLFLLKLKPLIIPKQSV